MDYKDYYKTLGVARNAKDKDIKAAFASWPGSTTQT